MSGKLRKEMTVGIACVGSKTKLHRGCVLRGNLIKFVGRHLGDMKIGPNRAKLYAICSYLLIKGRVTEIQRLVICNDEDFEYVRLYINQLLGKELTLIEPKFDIINITEFGRQLGRNIKSPADNYANSYRKRGPDRTKWDRGIKLNVVPINYELIKHYWNLLSN